MSSDDLVHCLSLLSCNHVTVIMSVSILYSSIVSEKRFSFDFNDLALTVANLKLSILYDPSRFTVRTYLRFLMLAHFCAVFS